MIPGLDGPSLSLKIIDFKPVLSPINRPQLCSYTQTNMAGLGERMKACDLKKIKFKAFDPLSPSLSSFHLYFGSHFKRR